MLDGKTIYIISKIPVEKGSSKTIMFEDERKVSRVRKWIPGDSRKDLKPAVEFTAAIGGVMTVRAADVVDVR